MKRLVDVDDESLAAARERLGTSTIKDTINTALRQVADQGPAAEDLDATLDALAGVDFEDRQQAWR